MEIFRLSFLSCILIPLLLGCSPELTSLQKEWPVVYYPSRANIPVHKGFIVLKNNDTMRGIIKLVYPNSVAIWPYGTKKDSKSVLFKPIVDIEYMGIYDDTVDDKSDRFYKYIKLGNDYLARLVVSNGEYKICDDPTNDFHKVNILVTPKDTVKMFTSFNLQKHFGNKKKLILMFINKRYGQNFSIEYFRDEKSMFDYILESEKEALENKKNN